MNAKNALEKEHKCHEFNKEDEYIAYGYDFSAAGTRVEELEEVVRIIKAMWHERQATVQGRHYRIVIACNEPKPNPNICYILLHNLA